MIINTIVVPQGAEYQAVCRGLQQAKVKNIQVIPIAIGTRNVEQTLANCSSLIDRQVLITGLCGSLCRQHAVGDGVVVPSCYNLNHDRLALESELTRMIQDKLSVDAVDCLTSDRLIFQAESKLKLAQKYPVSVVDMEGYSYILKLRHQGIPVAMLRVVSDDLSGDLPDLSRAIDDGGKLQAVPMAIAFIQQPITAIRLIQGSLSALKVLQQMIAKLYSS
ncbi:phosphorylase [Pleurocapsales cyanobacterium LEGE 10410]|nr:phosphorylase [Pleurocapsales cyanobacterium LEGE 10410]